MQAMRDVGQSAIHIDEYDVARDRHLCFDAQSRASAQRVPGGPQSGGSSQRLRARKFFAHGIQNAIDELDRFGTGVAVSDVEGFVDYDRPWRVRETEELGDA
jgi:hypothetical protein